MTSEAVPLLELRVLYGPQAGSRMSLSPGEYLLGSSDECDVVLAGSRMEERHALLVIDAGGGRLRPENGAISDALGNEMADEMVLAPGVCAELGGVAISLDRPDAPWTDGPARPLAAGAAPAAPVALAMSGEAPFAPPRETLFSGAQALRARGPILAISIIVLATVLGGALAAFFSGGDASATKLAAALAAPPAAPSEPPEALMRALRVLDPTHALSVTAQADGGWLVTGYVAAEADKKALLGELAALSPAPATKIFSDEAILHEATDALASRENSADAVLRLDNLGRGKLRLSGAARHAAAAQSAKLALLVVPGVVDVDMAVLMPDQLLSALKERIQEAGLGPRLSFVKEWPEVVVGGSLTPAEKARWDETMKGFKVAYGEILPVQVALSALAPDSVAMPINVHVIVGGAAPYIVTDRGVRMGRGSELAGNRLVAVSDSEVVFDGAQRWQIGR